MSDPATPTPAAEAKPDAAAKPAAAGPALPILIGAAAGALIVGAALGAFLVGPMVVKARAAAVVKAAPRQASKKPGEKTAVFRLDNIIVNPAGSAGTRFLMTAVVFELPDEKLVDSMKEKEVAIRDRVMGVLETQTLENLTAPGARDSLRTRIHAAVTPLVRGQVPEFAVYLPQFVIQ